MLRCLLPSLVCFQGTYEREGVHQKLHCHRHKHGPRCQECMHQGENNNMCIPTARVQALRVKMYSHRTALGLLLQSKYLFLITSSVTDLFLFNFLGDFYLFGLINDGESTDGKSSCTLSIFLSLGASLAMGGFLSYGWRNYFS